LEDRHRDEEILITLRRIIRATDVHSRSLAASHGLTGPQLMVLRELQRYPEISVSDLARDISLSPATVTDILDRLEKRGLINRARSEADRRRLRLSLTEAGLATLRKAPTLLQRHFVEEFRRLKDWEQSLLLASLQRVASMMELPPQKAALLSGETTWEEPPPEEESVAPVLAPLDPVS